MLFWLFIVFILTSVDLFQSIASVYTGLMQGVGAAEKVFEYLDRKPKHPQDGTEAPDICKGLVVFKDVSFAYPTRPETEILKVCIIDDLECNLIQRPFGPNEHI